MGARETDVKQSFGNTQSIGTVSWATERVVYLYICILTNGSTDYENKSLVIKEELYRNGDI